uniref:Zc3h12a-like Ribonuclease NYN domain-containing protein n=1 Tax=Setaria digitata TaxID=48799 RepID=A0A915PHL3_9BILA
METDTDEEDNSVTKRYIYNVELSRIISFKSIRRSVIERSVGTLLRPIVIDGLLIAASYDQNYTLDDRIGYLENYIQQKKPNKPVCCDIRTMKPYPVQALVKILFHFIARGHKATAFLPFFFKEQLGETNDHCALVSDEKQFRKLVILELIKFLPSEDFASHIKHNTVSCHGILVTIPKALYLNNFNSCQKCQPEESIAYNITPGTSCDLMDRTVIPEILFGNNKLPIIVPLFRPYNHRLVISLDSVHWKKILQVEEEEVSILRYNMLLRDEQLTLQMQSELLDKLITMIDGQFPCGPFDADIVPLIRHALGLTNQRISCQSSKKT